MALKGCPLGIPADLVQRDHPLRNVYDWSHNTPALKHSHRFHFAPMNKSDDGWRGAIFASQFRRNGSRLLLVEDDLNSSGLGFSAYLWAFTLLFAVRDNRVLLEAPRVRGGVPRWCDREPFTFQCLYTSRGATVSYLFLEGPRLCQEGDPCG